MLGRGQALASMPYQAYSGPLTAGQSGLQSQAFQGIAGLTVPSAVTDAANTVGQLSSQMSDLSYNPTAFSSTFNAPDAYQGTQFGSTFNAPDTYQGTQFNNTFNAPDAYTATDITTGQFTAPGVAQQYMNPYLQMSLDPQIAEARRQSEIQNLQNRTSLTRAGAFGGGRGALMESEAQRNLQSNLANITGQGYNTAYQQAQQAFTTDQARALQAAQAREQAQQFGYGQEMAGAQLGAQFGMEAQRAQEQAKQFGYGQEMAGAQFGAQQALEAQRAQEQAKQFGAQYGLQGLQAASQAAASQGQLGALQNQIQSQNLQTQLGAGAVQRGIEQEGIAADMAQFREERDYPYKQTQYMQSLLQGLPLATQSYSYSDPSILANAAGSVAGLQQLYDQMNPPPLAAPATPTTGS